MIQTESSTAAVDTSAVSVCVCVCEVLKVLHECM